MITSNVGKIMQEKGFTYIMLQEVTGLSAQTVTHARSDKIRNCRLYTLEAIADALGVGVKDLFEDGRENSPGRLKRLIGKAIHMMF